MNRDDILALAARVEALTGPDREVDAEIALAIGWRQVSEGHPLGKVWYDPDNINRYPYYWTTSLDAAMMLVPEGWTWCVASNGYVEVRHPLLLTRDQTTRARTPALALTAASLRAMAEEGELP